MPTSWRTQGYDTVVGGVPAYSTLGHFDDPILNTMLPYGRDQLAAIIFHELAHQLIYVPGDSAFNEAFASTVEETGLARWLTVKGRPADIENFHRSEARAREYSSLLGQARRDLARLYASKLPADADACRQAGAPGRAGRGDPRDREAPRRPLGLWPVAGQGPQQRAARLRCDLRGLHAGLPAAAGATGRRSAAFLCRRARLVKAAGGAARCAGVRAVIESE